MGNATWQANSLAAKTRSVNVVKNGYVLIPASPSSRRLAPHNTASEQHKRAEWVEAE